MKLRILSDLHLEFRKTFDLPLNKNDEILILAGDIGNPFSDSYQNFIKCTSENYNTVLIVSGNHEYYQPKHYMNSVNEQINNVCSKYNNVHFLNKSTIKIENITFIGCTLWSDISTTNKQSANTINDFNRIPNFTRTVYQELFLEHSCWLKETINSTTGKICVITHHLPSFKLIHPKYSHYTLLNSFFASNLESLMETVQYWICGHSHSYNECMVGNCKLFLNPIGYPNENSGFKELIITAEN